MPESETPVAEAAVAKKAVRKPAAKAVAKRWTIKKRQTFLDKLAETSNVALSARAAGMSSSHVYRLRRDNDQFRQNWAEALREGYARLEIEMLDRATNGTPRGIWHQGKKVEVVREFSDRLAIHLHNAHRGGVRATEAAEADAAGLTSAREQIAARLAEMHRRIGEAEPKQIEADGEG